MKWSFRLPFARLSGPSTRPRALAAMVALLLMAMPSSGSAPTAAYQGDNWSTVLIDGDEALASFAEDWGLPGNGSGTNPFVLDAQVLGNPDRIAWQFRNTEHHLLINGSMLPPIPLTVGILIDTSSNITLTHNTLSGGLGSVVVRDAEAIRIQRNALEGSILTFSNCTSCTIDNNSGTANAKVEIVGGNLNVVSNNVGVDIDVTEQGDGSNSRLGSLRIANNTGSQIRLLHLRADGWMPGLEVRGNDLTAPLSIDVSGATVAENTISCISQAGTSIQGVQFRAGATSNLFFSNKVINCEISALIDRGSEDNVLWNNWFASAWAPSVERTGLLPETGVGANQFHIPPTPGTNIVGGDTIGGNYWGPGFITPDLDGDGFGDIPYPSLLPDEYPLVLPS